MRIWLLVILSTLAKLALLPFFQKYLSFSPLLRTPLNDIRELKEMFYTYEHFGDFYLNTSQIGQSEYLLLALYKLNKHFDMFYILIAIELISILMKLYFIRQTMTKNKRLAVLWVLFNPISLLGGSSQNIGAFNDTLYLALILLMFKGVGYLGYFANLFAAVASYFDP